MRVNLGCGLAYMDGWLNVDDSPDVRADVHSGAFEFVRGHGPEIAELYMGHFLEHLLPGDARALLTLVAERLPAGAEVSAVTPDIRAIFAAYEAGEIDNRTLNESYVYSYVQPSHHLWCHDVDSLAELFTDAGFDEVRPIDPTTWPPVFHKTGRESMWQCGVRAAVPATRREASIADTSVTAAHPETVGAAPEPAATAAELLLNRIERLRHELSRETARAEEARQAAAEAEHLRREIDVLRHELTELRRSRTYAAARRLGRLSESLVPKGTRRRRAANLARSVAHEANQARLRLREQWAVTVGDDARPQTYEEWCADHDATDQRLAAQRQAARRAAFPLRVLVVVDATAGTDPALTLESLRDQSWRHWETCVLHGRLDVPDDPNPDPRVRWSPSTVDAYLSDANAGVNRTPNADFVLFVRAGDTIAPDCLYHVATVAIQDPLVDLVYWDDDLLDEGGRRRDPRFRPSWSPEALLGSDYVGSSFAMRLRRFFSVGGLRPDLGPAAFWDLLLRADLDAARVSRVPRVLAHLRHRLDQCGPEGERAVAEHLRALGRPATVRAEGACVRIGWQLDRWPKVSIVIPTRHNRPMLSRCLPSLATTDYPAPIEVTVVDNGAQTADNEAWWADRFPGLDLRVEWWDLPFNYSMVNNRAAARATGEVLVFLNDDTEVLDPDWLRELVGWAQQPEIGCVGLQLLDAEGMLQFAGTVVGLGGFADHVFQGLAPGTSTALGPTGWYRNVLAVTGACLALRRDVFESIGGFDERFVLCGSDVALGLDLTLAGLRNLCTPFSAIRHLESATRGTNVPPEDFYTSYWRYQSWLFGGDPYYSPNLSLASGTPRLRSRSDKTVGELIAPALGRSFQVFRQRNDAAEASGYADNCRATKEDVRATRALHAANRAPFEPETINWFIPDIDSPFYGGINTAFRIADHLARNHGVTNRFLVWGPGPEAYVRSGMAAAFPALGRSQVIVHDGSVKASLGFPPADVSIATLWVTAYQLAHFPSTRRKFYLMQDFEPSFHPAGTLYALAEESYRLGLYGLCNTSVMQQIYSQEYGGHGRAFVPAVDPTVFHAEGRHQRTPDSPVTVFVYARPGHWRNCWELAGLALAELKERLGDGVRIVAAGSWAGPEGDGLESVVKHLGLLDYRATGPLYRDCDVGLALTVSKHPSYLPLELMACGVPVVAFDSPHFSWLLRDGENSLLAERTVDGVAEALERLVVDPGLRHRLSEQGLADIAASHSSWEKALAGVYPFLSDPEGPG